MRIGIDARPMQEEISRYRGIGRALEFFLTALKDCVKKDEQIVFYVDDGLPAPEIIKLFPESRIIRIATSRLGRKRYIRSVLPSFPPIKPDPKDVDLLLQYDASFGVPKSVPTVVIFHDLIPYLFRGQEKRRPARGLRKAKDTLAREMYWKKYLRVWKNYKDARKVIAISESSKRDLLKHIPEVKSENIKVIYHGAQPPKKVGPPSASAKLLVDRPFLLYVGAIDLRKNIVGLLETFYQLKPKHPELRLVLAGNEFKLKDQLESLGWYRVLASNKEYAKDVLTPGFVSDTDLQYLYKQAACFVMASRYEGFGLPVLEAMAAGCPVVAYDNSSIPEVTGDAALLVKDGRPLAPAIEKVLKSPELRKQMITKGKKQAEAFTWADTAQKTLRVLKSL